MKVFNSLKLIMLILLFSFSLSAQTGETNPCLQDRSEKLRLLKSAEDNKYNIRYITIVGNTYTRYPAFRKNWDTSFNEGSIFTQEILMKSIKGTNKLKTIKKISLDNIEVRLEENDNRGWNAIDFTICVEHTAK